MESLKNRNEIDIKDKWDLTKMFSSYEEVNDKVKELEDYYQELLKMKGHILDNKDTLKKYLEIDEKFSRLVEKVYVYCYLKSDEDTANTINKGNLEKIESTIDEWSDELSFTMPELMEKDFDYVWNLIKDDNDLKEYKTFFKRIYHLKNRIKSKEEEKIISLASSAFGGSDTFTSLDTTDALFGKITVDDKKVELTQYNYPVLIINDNQKVRKNTFNTFYKFYKNHKNTFASMLKNNYQELEFYRKIRGYDSALKMKLDKSFIDESVYHELIEAIHKYNYINQDFQKLKAHELHLDNNYHLYDTYISLKNENGKKYSFKEAKDLVIKALSVLGKDYISSFNSIFDSQSVDIYPNKGKHTGAYHYGVYDSNNYVLLNFNGEFGDVSTLAHELGHAVHSKYSKESNSYIYADYDIFIAEIASTVNETLLSMYMLDNASTKEEKIYYLTEFLNKVKATIYRQTMFSEFEEIMSKRIQEHKSMTEKDITDIYYNLNKEYFKDSVIIDDDIRYECLRIPHFYTPFYVYKYATGMISAIAIVNSILNKKEGFPEKYIEFLRSGSRINPLDILKIVDVDLSSSKTYDEVFNFIEDKYLELKELVGE